MSASVVCGPDRALGKASARPARPFIGRRRAWSFPVVLVSSSRIQTRPLAAKSSSPMSSTLSAVTSDRRRPPLAKASISMGPVAKAAMRGIAGSQHGVENRR